MSEPQPTELVTSDSQPSSQVPALIQWLGKEEQLVKLGEALPPSLNIVAFKRCLFSSMQRTPKLLQCTKESVWDSCIKSAQAGLLPDGYHAHLVPLADKRAGVIKCNWWPDWKGLVRLALNSGLVLAVDADVVCDNDEFEYVRGTDPRIRHVAADVHPNPSKRKARGQVFAVYAVAQMPGGGSKIEVMSYEDIDAIRKRSRAGQDGPWVTDWGEMAKKTVLKRMFKSLPRSPELHNAISADDDRLPEFPDHVKPTDPDEAQRTGPEIGGEKLPVDNGD